MTDDSMRLLATAISVLPLSFVALALGKIFSDWLTAIGRNPGAADQMQSVGLLAFALTEAVGLFVIIVALLILFTG